MDKVLEENSDVVTMTGISDCESENICHGGLFLPDDPYVPTTLAQVRKVFRAIRADARIGGRVPGDRSGCVACEELQNGYTFFTVGTNAFTREPGRSHTPVGSRRLKSAARFEDCPNPRCYGTLNKAGICSECGSAVIDGNPMEGTQREHLD